MIDGSNITIVALFEHWVRLVISELIVYTEVQVVSFITTSSQNIISRIIQDNLLWVVDTLGTSYVLNVVCIHIGKGCLCVSIRCVVISGANNSLLRDIKIVFAREQTKRAH